MVQSYAQKTQSLRYTEAFSYATGPSIVRAFFLFHNPVFIVQVAHQNISSIDLDTLSMSDASSIASPDHRSDLGHRVLVNYVVFENLLNHTQRFFFSRSIVPPRCAPQEGEGSWWKVPSPRPLWIPISGWDLLFLIVKLSFPPLRVILESTGIEASTYRLV